MYDLDLRQCAASPVGLQYSMVLQCGKRYTLTDYAERLGCVSSSFLEGAWFCKDLGSS